MADAEVDEVVLGQQETDGGADPALDAANVVEASPADAVDVAAATEVDDAGPAAPTAAAAGGLEGDDGQEPPEEDPAEAPQTEDPAVEADPAYAEAEADVLPPPSEDAAVDEPVLAVPEADGADVPPAPQADVPDCHDDEDAQAADVDADDAPEAAPMRASLVTGGDPDVPTGAWTPPPAQQREDAEPSDAHARATSAPGQGFSVHRIRRLLAADAAAGGSSVRNDNLLFFQNPRSVHFPVVSVPPANAAPAVQDVAAQRAATDRLRALLAHRDARAQREEERAQAEAEARAAARERRRAEAETTHALVTAQMQGHSEVRKAPDRRHGGWIRRSLTYTIAPLVGPVPIADGAAALARGAGGGRCRARGAPRDAAAARRRAPGRLGGGTGAAARRPWRSAEREREREHWPAGCRCIRVCSLAPGGARAGGTR